MKISARFDRSWTARRGGFTLMELLVVITIIAALMALTASATMKFITSQQMSNTQSTLDRVQSQLNRAWSKVKDQANKEPIPANVMALAGTDANAAARARVIYVKLRMRQQFPMNFAEALNVPYQNPELATWGLPTLVPGYPISPLPAQPGYVSYLASLGITAATVSTQPFPQYYESSACLLMALQRGVSGAGINAEELTSGGAAGNLNGIPILVDAWNRPIYFSRFPVGCPSLNPTGLPQTGANDPGDPQGLLNSSAWYTQTVQQTIYSQLTLQKLAPYSSTPMSYKQAPLVASGGQDNWSKSGLLTFDPLTFAPGYFNVSTQAFTLGTTGTGVQYSGAP